MSINPVFPTWHNLLCILCCIWFPITPLYPDAPLIPVIVSEAKVSQFEDRIEALGTLRANETVDLTASVSELVTRIGFQDGQRVKKGDVLLELQSAEEGALLNEARANENEARLQFERSQQLAARGSTAASELDEARRNYATAKARLLAIESRIGNLVVLAPFDGVVGLRNISLGALVRPGDLITTLDDDSKMLLDFAVPSSFLPVLAIGSPVKAKAAGFQKEPFEGEVRSISSRIDPVTRTVVVRAEIPNPKLLLKPGLLMTVELRSNQREAIMIPEESLMPVGDKFSVLVLDDSVIPPVANQREVLIGGRRTGEVEILEGVAAGEKVVSHGTLRVADGAAVRILSVNDKSKSIREQISAGGEG